MANQSIKEAFQRFWEYVTAKINNQTMVVTITKNDSTYTADRTYAEIVAHLDAGGKCEAVYVNGTTTYVMHLVGRYSNGLVTFGRTEYMSGFAQATAHIYESGNVYFYSTVLNTHIQAGDGRLVEVDVSTATVTNATLSKLQYVKIGRLTHISLLAEDPAGGETVKITLPKDSVPFSKYSYWRGAQYLPAFIIGGNDKVATYAQFTSTSGDNATMDIYVNIPAGTTGDLWIDGSYITAE